MAVIDWEAVPALIAGGVPASSGELRVLCAAASLAGVDTGPLRELTASLDVDNLAAVLDAIVHCSGWHEHGLTHTVTGLQGEDDR